LAGQTLCLGNLNPTRDFNFVSNTVDGYLLAATSKNAVGQTINLGSGREISIGNLAQLIGRLLDQPVKVASEKKRLRPENSEVERLLADNTLAQRLLGWTPKITLENGLTQTIEWLRQHADRYRPKVYAV
jgi:dTDP-glucose 4,6-dehydratase